MNPELSMVAKMFKANSDIFAKATAEIPADQWLKRPDSDSNHLLWIAGHVVVHRGMVLRILGQSWSSPWEQIFARGAKLDPSASYPKPDGIAQAWRGVSEQLFTVLPGAPADILAKPSPQGVPSLDGTNAGTVGVLCLHETYHVGQMSYLRKWLGYGQVVG